MAFYLWLCAMVSLVLIWLLGYEASPEAGG